MDPEIRRYLDEHGATYTPEALRRGLLDAGYDAVTVSAALREWQSGQAAAGPDRGDQRTFRRWAVRLHLAALVVTALLLLLFKGLPNIGLIGLAAAVLGVTLIIGWAVSSLFGRMLLPRAGVGIALVVPAISAIALGGSCFALINGSVQQPSRPGTVHLGILAPLAFEGDGPADCFVGGGRVGATVNSQELGTLDGKAVSAYLTWFGAADPSVAQPEGDGTLSILLDAGVGEKLPLSYTTIFSTRIVVDAAPDSLTGTMQFEGLAPEPNQQSPGESPPEPISGSLTWTCK
jgi:hypothetical protein